MTPTSPVLGLVPARGGSKGLPGKNLRQLVGRPLLRYAIEAATRSGVVDRVVLTTDSDEIAAAGRLCGAEVPFIRPAELAEDATPMLPVVEHALAMLEQEGWQCDIVLLIQPTAPLRRPEQLARAVAMLRDTGADAVASVVEVPRHFSPDYVMRVEDGRLVPFLAGTEQIGRRQDARPAFVRDGTVYAFWRRTVAEYHSLYGQDCRPLVIPAAESVTIDTQEDWAEAERRLALGTAPPP
ncbi:MAG: acylneuraminate cytidylyltransferase family protein [Acidobacteriota bacterium]